MIVPALGQSRLRPEQNRMMCTAAYAQMRNERHCSRRKFGSSDEGLEELETINSCSKLRGMLLCYVEGVDRIQARADAVKPPLLG